MVFEQLQNWQWSRLEIIFVSRFGTVKNGSGIAPTLNGLDEFWWILAIARGYQEHSKSARIIPSSRILLEK